MDSSIPVFGSVPVSPVLLPVVLPVVDVEPSEVLPVVLPVVVDPSVVLPVVLVVEVEPVLDPSPMHALAVQSQ
jgi:hypothetical protein